MFSFLKKYFRLAVREIPQKEEPITDIKVRTAKESIADIIEGWKYCNVELNEGASDDLIRYTQNQLDFVFPTDFTGFYKQVNGFKNWDMTDEMFSIWSLERILEEHQNSDDKHFILFCDFLINSHQIGYVKGESGIFKSYDECNSIAASFEETIILIEQKSDKVY